MHSGINFALIVGLFCLSSVNSEAVPQELVGEAGLNKVRETYAKAMVMFYAPWCPHCQEAKPKYNEAMGKLTDKTSTFAYVNCDNAQNSALCTKEKIEGYPTIKVYQKGKDPVNFEADFTADSFINFLKNPVASAPGPQSKEPPVADPPMADVTYIKGAVDFKLKMSKVPHALVFFYAPWCPHCQEAKPKYSKAATTLKADKERGLFAVNCDQPENTAFCTSEKVEGFPTIRYYFKGEMFQEVEEELETDPLLNIIRNPPKTKVPPTPVEEEKPGAKPDGTPAATPPPPEAKDGEKPLTDADRQPEKPQDLMKGITYLTGATAKDIMTKNPDTLVKFYAPWCPHCMEAKPIYQAANDQLKKAGSKALLAAINCDSKENEKWCEDEKVDGFPTLAYYYKGKKVKVYDESPPTTAGIVKFVSNLPRPKEEL